MHISGAPMFEVNTGWIAYNFFTMYRNWGGYQYREVSAGDQSSFRWWGPNSNPAYYHTLYNERKGYWPYGNFGCVSWITGSYVNGPVRSGCIHYNLPS
jgi:hypothetical protein